MEWGGGKLKEMALRSRPWPAGREVLTGARTKQGKEARVLLLQGSTGRLRDHWDGVLRCGGLPASRDRSVPLPLLLEAGLPGPSAQLWPGQPSVPPLLRPSEEESPGPGGAGASDAGPWAAAVQGWAAKAWAPSRLPEPSGRDGDEPGPSAAFLCGRGASQ